ncbi:MAG: oligosaccharide repeat unit polymerase [Gammaproteobacteria bacterium]|nr:MAG: oligosaccharide repeat unit polymerase [Gammaproteobacteria bacterium]UTW42501.1 oligosaccharide repeat unit polymerase [bacterium SCSIO 12844]
MLICLILFILGYGFFILNSRIISPLVVFFGFNCLIFFISYFFSGAQSQYSYAIFLVIISIVAFTIPGILFKLNTPYQRDKLIDVEQLINSSVFTSIWIQCIIFVGCIFLFYLRLIFDIGIPGKLPTSGSSIINFIAYNGTTWALLFYITMLCFTRRKVLSLPVVIFFILYGFGNAYLGWRGNMVSGIGSIFLAYLMRNDIKLISLFKIKYLFYIVLAFIVILVLFYIAIGYRAAADSDIPLSQALLLVDPYNVLDILSQRISMLDNLNHIVLALHHGLILPLIDSSYYDQLTIAQYHVQMVIGQSANQINGVSSTGIGSIYILTGSAVVVFVVFFIISCIWHYIYYKLFQQKNISAELCAFYIMMIWLIRQIIGEQLDIKTTYTFIFLIILYFVFRLYMMIVGQQR